MPTEPLTNAIGHLRKAALADAGLTDGQLLDAYLQRRDEAAFECLVWRHGPAVLGACRRALGNDADAEDAFQATFLVLVRKGHVVRPRGAVGAWLYGVACNVARKARADAARRRAKELSTARPAAIEPADPDLRPVIDLEVGRLPEKYRVPVVMCEIEGQPIADAARTLGWPQGTVASRLARGRDLLARRLTRHGLTIGGLAVATVTPEAVAGVLRAVRGARPAAAERLADGVVRCMFVAKLKTGAAIVACAAVVLVGGLAYRMSAGENGDPPKADPAKPEANPLLGRWKLVKQDYNGVTQEPPGVRQLLITEQWLQFSGIGLRSPLYAWKASSLAAPATLDLEQVDVDSKQPHQAKAILKLDDDKLTVAVHHLPLYGVPGNDKITGRPKDFTARDTLILTFERDKAQRPDFERLVGRWRVVGKRDYRILEFREQPHAGLLIAEKENHEADWFSWVTDERTDPRRIDVSARVEGGAFPNQGIYRFDGDRLLIYLGAPLQFQGNPGKHTRPTDFEADGKIGERYLVLERETVAWGEPLRDGLQFGLLAEPNGRTTVELGETVTFRLFVRNTTSKAVDVEAAKTDGDRRAWEMSVKDGKGNAVPAADPPEIPNDPVPPTVFKSRLVDYRVADLGPLTLSFHSPEDVKRAANPAYMVPARPGVYTVRVASGAAKTGEVKLTVEPVVAWGKAVNGLQFGLALGDGQSARIHVGERARFRLLVRNTSDQPRAIGYLPVRQLPSYVQPEFAHDSDPPLIVHWVRGPKFDPPARSHAIPAKTTAAIPGEFALPFVPFTPLEETSVVARPGTWKMSLPKLGGWMSEDAETGRLTIEIVPGDKPHTDSQRIAWGPVVDGLQFGVRPEKAEYQLGDTVKFEIHARNMGNESVKFEFPQLAGMWAHGRIAVHDTRGAEVKTAPSVPPGFPPAPKMTSFELKTGMSQEVGSGSWVFVGPDDRAERARDHVVLTAGTYTVQYPNLRPPDFRPGKPQPARQPWPTGPASVTFLDPVAPRNTRARPDAERLIGRWTVAEETLAGKPVRDGKYRVLGFQAQPGQGLLIAEDAAGKGEWFSWQINPAQHPRSIDLWARVPGKSIPIHGIYEFVRFGRLRIGLGAPLAFQGDPGKHERPGRFEDAAQVFELEPDPVAWGVEKDGLQFGLTLAPGQPRAVPVGEAVGVKIWVRNVADAEKEYTAIPSALRYTVMPEVSRGGTTWKVATNPPPVPPQAHETHRVPGRSTRAVAEVTYDFLPALGSGSNGVEAKPGAWELRIAELWPFLGVKGYTTGKLPIEVLAGDVAHVDRRGVSWGPVVAGLQYGIRFDPPDKRVYPIGESMSLELFARNWSGDVRTFDVPEAEFMAQVGWAPTLRVTPAKEVALYVTPRDSLPRPRYRRVTLRAGAADMVMVSRWPLLEQRPEGNAQAFVVTPGDYAIWFKNLGDPEQDKSASRATGELKFTVK